ncbi:50S ribosomal protein L44e [Candidatus Gugararchaeum adminiculabundum]|nr:50S ribosomal protein L44e [Candidatus Gugararchaeum adminiculabundum]
MKFPKEVNKHCPKCNKHTVHTAKVASKGKARALAMGQRKHERKLTGYGGKVAGEKSVRKQGKRQKVMLTCKECKKKHELVVGSRTKKKIEIKA